MVEVSVLGPLEVRLDGVAVSLAGKKQRALLALLVVQANEVVSVDRLIDELWGERPPATARAALHNYVAQLRRLLGVEAIATVVPGYLLRLDPDQLDLARFERLLSRAEAERATPAARARSLETALDLWRGPPFADIYYESFLQPEIRRLDELRVTALEDLCAAKLEYCSPSDLVAELQYLVKSYPSRERLRRQLMVALYRSGRGVDALRTYVEWRAQLREEWETEPGGAIQQTAKDIQAQRPELTTAVLWGRHAADRPGRRRGNAPDPLEMLDIPQALTIFDAVERVAAGLSDGLERLEAGRAEKIVDALLRCWTV